MKNFTIFVIQMVNMVIFDYIDCFLHVVPVDSAVLEIEFAVVVADFSHNSARVAHCHYVCRDILCHHTACADDGVLPYGDAGHNESPCPYPYVFADMDGHIVLIVFFSQFRNDGMTACCYCHVWSKHNIVPYVHMGVVNDRKVEVGIDVVAEMNMMSAPVCVERRLDVAIFAQVSKHLF